MRTNWKFLGLAVIPALLLRCSGCGGISAGGSASPIGILPFFHVDNAAHLGGLAAGFAIAFLAGTPRLVGHWVEKLWLAAASLSVLVTVVAFLQMFWWFSRV